MTFDGTAVVTAIGVVGGWLAGVVVWVFGLSTRVSANKAAADVSFAETHGRIDVLDTRQAAIEADVKEIKADVKEILGRL